MVNWKNWKRWLVSDPSLPLEDQFFQTLCLLGGAIALFVVVPINYFQNLSPWVDRGVVAFGFGSLLAAWLARKGRYYKKAYLIGLVVLLDLIWFPNGGSQGSIGLYYFAVGLFLVLFFKGAFRNVGIVVLVANVIGLHLVEFAWPQIPHPFPAPVDRLLDLISGYLISLFLSVLILWVVQRGFNQERQRVRGNMRDMAERESELRAIFESSYDAIAVSRQGIHEMVNPAFLAMFGYDRAEDVVGKSPMILLAPESRDPVLERIRARADGVDAPHQYEAVGLRRDGSRFPLEVHVSTYERAGAVYTMVSLRDLSERVRLEVDRQHYEAQARRNEKMESLGALAGGVAHDMNNVLGAVLGLASVHLEDAEPGSTLRNDMETIVKACERGGTMVRGLLGFARETLPEERELDLNLVVRETVALLERTTLQRIHLEMDLARDLRPIKGDFAALKHALMNLCVNALDAMPERGTLSVRTCNEGEGAILLEVADTGMGMSKDVLDKAMDPFFTTKPQGKGTGLGLPIVFGTVKAHQGKMEIHSEVDRGTRVHLRFPSCQIPVEPPRAEVTPPTAPVPAGKRILVVDDDELLQHAVRRLLKNLGHVATSVAGGEDALAMIEGGFVPDLVILDMNMPGMDGTVALPRIRALCPKVPVLLATGRADQSAIDLVESHARVTLLPKPFDLRNLREMIEFVSQQETP